MASRRTGAAIRLLSEGHGDVRVNRDVAWPMIGLTAVLHMLLQSLLRPFGPLDPARPDNIALLALLAATGLLVGVALALAVLWSRTVFLGRTGAMAGGLQAFLRRWGAALVMSAWAVLLWLILLLPAMLMAGTLGLALSLIAGGLPAAVQLVIALVCLALPTLAIGTALWAGVGQAALDRPVTLVDIMLALSRHWAEAIGLTLLAALLPLLLAGLLVLLAPQDMTGMIARGALSACMMLSVLLVMPPLVRLSGPGRATS